MTDVLFGLEIVGSTLTCNNCGRVNRTGTVESSETEFVCAIESGMDITPPECDECGASDYTLRLYANYKQ